MPLSKLLPTKLDFHSFLQGVNFFLTIPKQLTINPIVSWYQLFSMWIHSDSDAFYLKAAQTEIFKQYQRWQLNFNRELNLWLRTVINHYRLGRLLYTDESLNTRMLEHQATFKPEIHSAFYYNRRLKTMARQLPLYAHAIEGACHYFHKTLQRNSLLALQHFYQDIQYHLVLVAGKRISLQYFKKILTYYQTLISSPELQSLILAQLNSLNTQLNEREKDFFDNDLGQKIEAILLILQNEFLKTASSLNQILIPDDVALSQKAKPSLISSIQASLKTGYFYLGQNPFQLLKKPWFWRIAIQLIAWLTKIQSVTAQEKPETWIKTLGGNFYDTGNSVQQTTDGGYIVTGETCSYGTNCDLWFSKWTADGAISWVKILGGNSTDVGNAVHNTTDDGYIVTGSTQSFGNGLDDLWLSKWEANGTLAWTKILGGSGSDIGTCVEEAADGSYVVAGHTDALNDGNNDLWLSKWATNGTLLWVKTLGGPYKDYVYAMQRTTDNGYILTGKTNSFGAGNFDLWLSKWAENGTLTWVKALGGYSDDYGYSVFQTAEGGYIATGSTQSYGAGKQDLWLSKWDENGNITWLKTLGGSEIDYGGAVMQITDGNYIVIGYTFSFGSLSDINLMLSKWMPDGSLTWIKNLGGNNQDFSYSMLQTSDGGYIMTGYTYSYGAGSVDLWLLKWDDQGSLNTCALPLLLSNLTLSINSVDIPATPLTPSILSQDLEVTPQDVNPTVMTICKPAISSTASGTFIYTKGDPPTIIDNTITVTDIEITNLISAQISIVNGFVNGEDELGFNNQNSIIGNYNQTTGILDLTGISSVANYQIALQSITYRDISFNPSTALRTFRFVVSDSQLVSNAIFRNATIIVPATTAYMSTGTAAAITTFNPTTGTTATTTFNLTTQIQTTAPSGGSITTVGTTNFNPTIGTTATTGLLSTGTTTDQTPIVTTENPRASSTAASTKSNSPNGLGNSEVIFIGVAIAGGVALVGTGIGIGYWLYKRRISRKSGSHQSMELQISPPPPPPLPEEQNPSNTQNYFLPGTRQPKGHTIIGNKYALINSLSPEEAEELRKQTGIEVTFLPGKKKSKFVLGQGQFGKLRLAQDIETGQFVGVKKIKGKAIASSQQEAKIQIKLTGLQNILPLFHTAKATGSKKEETLYQFILLAGFGDGGELQKRLAELKDSALKEQLLIYTFYGLLTGMMHMHEQGIYHFDMKPSNFVVDYDGEVYVTDFGCAVQLQNSRVDSLQNRLNGDGRYYSPERWANLRLHYKIPGEIVNDFEAAKADSWAVGVTILEIALNRYPFNSYHTKEERLQHCNNHNFRELLKQLPELQNADTNSFWAIVKALLTIDPKKRLSVKKALEMPIFQRKDEFEFENKEIQKQAFINLKHQSNGSTLEENLIKQEKPHKKREAHYIVTPDSESSVPQFSSAKESVESSLSSSISLSNDESDTTNTRNHSQLEQEKSSKKTKKINYIHTPNYEFNIPSPSSRKEDEGAYSFTSGESDTTDVDDFHPKFIYQDTEKEKSFSDREEEDEATELPNQFISPSSSGSKIYPSGRSRFNMRGASTSQRNQPKKLNSNKAEALEGGKASPSSTIPVFGRP